MAIYNTPFELFKRAIDSVLNQDFRDFEIIVVNDGSEDALSK
ncbi:MAG: glycosyltransferase, partial [Flavobacteriales bacterium]